MLRRDSWVLVLCLGVSITLPAQAQDSAAPVPVPVPASEGFAPAAAQSKPFEEIIKLWRANLSEDFVKRQIETGSTVYDLNAEDMIRCRDAGLPESLINVMLQTRLRKNGEPARAAAPPSSQPLSSNTAPPPLAAEANRRWEGLARRNSGMVVLKSRWDVGTLEFKEESIRWVDARDAGKNLLIPARQITEQFLTCEKKSGGNECFEWGFKTRDGGYRFRDVSWQQGENKKPLEIYEFMKAIYPSLVSSNIPVDSK
ncbi:MAG: hypothetical protein ABIT01_06155 [Thermoanaerobaculia bacterium]